MLNNWKEAVGTYSDIGLMDRLVATCLHHACNNVYTCVTLTNVTQLFEITISSLLKNEKDAVYLISFLDRGMERLERRNGERRNGERRNGERRNGEKRSGERRNGGERDNEGLEFVKMGKGRMENGKGEGEKGREEDGERGE